MKPPVSIVMIVKNEAQRIKECLDSVSGWADEVIIVDDESTDNTCQVAREYTDKIFTRKMKLEGKQRNYGASKAKNEWVMTIDSDERMTPELKKEIDEVLSKENKEVVAYWIPTKNYLGNYWLRHGGWYPAPHIKLYNKNYLVWKETPDEVVHPGIKITQGFRGGTLKNHLIHYSFKNIEDFVKKLNRQTTLEAIKWHLNGKKISLGHGLWKSFDRFMRGYVRKKGYKDGYYGLVVAVLSGLYQFFAYSKLREIKEKGTYL
ncbi:MAG: glycosyltransferase family 2 protein [Omnitrophica bacterium]|nr:glycosyltransferase family 2 protein [Candidatus Omnitrophota bacterium]